MLFNVKSEWDDKQVEIAVQWDGKQVKILRDASSYAVIYSPRCLIQFRSRNLSNADSIHTLIMVVQSSPSQAQISASSQAIPDRLKVSIFRRDMRPKYSDCTNLFFPSTELISSTGPTKQSWPSMALQQTAICLSRKSDNDSRYVCEIPMSCFFQSFWG